MLKIKDEELSKIIIKVRHEIHQNPELSNQENETTKLIKDFLEKHNIRICDYSGKTGVVAEIGSGNSPYVALRADIDALPLQEKTNLVFKSQVDGVAHSCGHDFHIAALLGGALLLKNEESVLKGTVRLLFQPGEERHTGAREMIKNGVLKNVSAIAGFHNMPGLPVGTIGVKSGKLMASNDNFDVLVRGVGSHAAIPEKSKDPIITVVQMIEALQTIRSRNISPSNALVLTVGSISGGQTYNVIPDHASFKGTIRTYLSSDRELAKKRFYTLINSLGAAFEQKVDITWDRGPSSVNNDEVVTKLLTPAFEKIMNVVPAIMSNADDDFAEYQQIVPGFYGFLGSNGLADLHHSDFTCDDKGLLYGAKFHYLSAKVLLKAIDDGKLLNRQEDKS